MNILGDRQIDHDALLTHLRASMPAYVVVMDNPALAVEIAASTPCRVIYRHWAGDDNAHTKGSAVDFVRARHALAPAGTWLYLGNEPGGNLPLLATWSLEALAECDRLGRRGVCLNLSTGHPEPRDWIALASVVEYAYAHGHTIGLHEYFSGKIENSTPWHVGRHTVLQQFAGARCPQIVITELGCAVNLDPFAGWRGRLTVEQYAVQLDIVAHQYAAAGIAGACLFSFGAWADFDVSDPTLLSRITQINEALHMSEQPTWIEGTVRPADARSTVNVRSAPSTDAVKTGDLRQEKRGRYAAVSGTNWTQINLDDGLAGYVRNDVVVLGLPVVIPPDEPQPPGHVLSLVIVGASDEKVEAVRIAFHEWVNAGLKFDSELSDVTFQIETREL